MDMKTEMVELRGDASDSVKWLQWLREEGPWVLTSIPPEGGITETVTFKSSETEQLKAWVAERDGRLNLYYMTNPARGVLTIKAKKEHVKAMEFFHVDLDPRKPPKDTENSDLAAWVERERARIRAQLDAFEPAPSAVVDSGGGYQAFWRLSEPIPIDGVDAKAEAAEAYNRQLQFVLGGDNTHNCDRIMRLPGTVNVPDARKRAKGRVERVARVVRAAGHAYSTDEFTAASTKPDAALDAGPVLLGEIDFLPNLDGLPEKVTQRTKMLIVQGNDPGDLTKYGSRSDVVWAVTCELVRAGCDDNTIAAVLLDPDWGISAHVRDQKRSVDYAARQIGRARAANPPSGVQREDFYAYLPRHLFIFAPTGEQWPASSVNETLPPVPLLDFQGNPVTDEDGKQKTLRPSTWLDQNRAVQQMTWCPGLGAVVKDRLVADGGWLDRPGCDTFNLYRAPAPPVGEAALAGPWLDHVRRVYPGDADHAIRWMAHRVQRPQDKINHALFLGGAQGIGKDTLLEPLKAAVGAWNFAEVSPQQMFGRFNGFAKSVVLRISEARDLGDKDRFEFYDHMKTYTAAPPDVLRVDEKNLREHAVFNVCGVIITSNHKLDGIHLPADDRRHYVAWSELTKEDFSAEYWVDLWKWYAAGGIGHVAAYLAALDLSAFNAKAPPPKTEAFREIVAANMSQDDADLADALDRLGAPKAVTIEDLVGVASLAFRAWLEDRRNNRRVRHRLSEAGYTFCANPGTKDGRWKVERSHRSVYTRRELSVRDALGAAEALASGAAPY